MNKPMTSRPDLLHVVPALPGLNITPEGRGSSPSVSWSNAEVGPMRTFTAPPPMTLTRLLEAIEQQYAVTAR